MARHKRKRPDSVQDVMQRASLIVAEHAFGVTSLDQWAALSPEEQEMCRDIAHDIVDAFRAAGITALPPRERVAPVPSAQGPARLWTMDELYAKEVRDTLKEL